MPPARRAVTRARSCLYFQPSCEAGSAFTHPETSADVPVGGVDVSEIGPDEGTANWIGNAMITLASILVVLAQTPAPSAGGFPFFEPVQPSRTVEIVAHRVGSGLAPEETARAVEASIADAVEWAEVTVRRMRDGHHVLYRDDELDGRTDATGACATAPSRKSAPPTRARFGRRFTGERILTLEEGLRLARGRINLRLDCKDVDPALLAREVLAAKMGRQVVVCASLDVLRAVRGVAGEAIGLMAEWRPAFGMAPWIEDVRPHAVEIDAADLTAAACGVFHRAGIKVQARVLGDDDRPEVWDRAAAAGVDWIRTDRSEEVLRTSPRRGSRSAASRWRTTVGPGATPPRTRWNRSGRPWPLGPITSSSTCVPQATGPSCSSTTPRSIGPRRAGERSASGPPPRSRCWMPARGSAARSPGRGCPPSTPSSTPRHPRASGSTWTPRISPPKPWSTRCRGTG